MKLVKTRWPHYWIELHHWLTMADIKRLFDAARQSTGAHWRMRWNNQLGAIEFYTQK